MPEAESRIAWLPMCVIVRRAALPLGCAVEHARLRIIQKGEAGQIKACGLTAEGWPVSLLPAAWRGINRDVDVDLRLDALIAADLLPAPAERARWPAALALAYIIEGMPLKSNEWTAAMVRQTERAEIALGEAIGADPELAWGRRSPYGPIEQIPIGDFRAEMVERKGRPPISATHLPKVVVRVDGNLGISPAHRVADYRGTHWSSIECDSTRLKQAFPKPLRVERRMLNEAEQLYAEGGSELAPPTESPRVEPVPPPEPAPCQERPHLRLVSGARSGEIEAPAQSTPEAGTGPEEAPVSAANAALKPIEPAATESVSEWPSAEQLGIMKAPKQKAILRKWPGLCRRYPHIYNADKVRAEEVSGGQLAGHVGDVDPNTARAFLAALRVWLGQQL